ncbi:MAG: signal peptidase II [Eubacteriales bacterium]
MNKSPLYFMYYFLIAGLFLFDQVSKFMVRKNLACGESIPVFDKIFHITYVQNTGASFGVFSEHTKFLTYFTLLILAVIFGYVIHFRRSIAKGKKNVIENVMSFSFALIFSGGFGNAVDRLARGYVTDMFDFRIWPVFNVADIYICVGCFLLLICIIKYDKKGIGNE